MQIAINIITVFVAVIGWIVAHRLSSNRDRSNKRRDLRVQHLMSDYLKLENCIHRSPTDVGKDLEAVVASIQLLGTKEQVLAAKRIADDISNKGSADLEALLKMLRNDLRSELELDKNDQPIQFLRMQVAQQNIAADR